MRSELALLLAAAGLVCESAAADWISAAEPRGSFGATSFVRAFGNGKAVRRAEWKVSGLGVFQAFVNGREVGGFLKPGFTHVKKCRHVYTCDVTDSLRRGAGETNVLSATVSSGWWRDMVVERPRADSDLLPFEDELGVDVTTLGGVSVDNAGNYVARGADNAFWGELVLTYEDGATETVATDPLWRSARAGALSDASIYDGEDYDARVDESWRETGRVDWPQAKKDTQFKGEMRPAAAEVTLREDLAFVPREMYVVRGATGAGPDAYGVARIVRFCTDGESVVLNPGEELVVDFGQNAAAVCAFELAGAAGTVMTVRHAEMLNEGGGLKSRGNDGPEGTLYLANLRGARAAVVYTLKDGEQSYRPSYSFFGYRYIGVTATDRLTVRRVRSVPVTSVTKAMETGTIETGSADVNRLISNVRWGMYSNYLSIPTDCPQRNERLGWTGDTQVFIGAALFNADVRGFFSKWMADMRDSQLDDGAFLEVVPVGVYGREGGVSAWSDAGVIVPYRLWRRYGDSAVIRENWAAMTRYLDCLELNGGHLRNSYGDWLAYENNDETIRKFVGDVYFLSDARMMEEMARAIREDAAAERFGKLATRLRAEARERYLDGKGVLKEEFRTQTTLLFALRLGLVEGTAFDETKRQLVERIRGCGTRLQTGFLGTAHLLEVLTDVGESELATSLLLQHDEPSWLYSVDQGATTIWERWNSYTKAKGFGPVSMNSFNHYSYGAVLGWMYETLAGIREDPSAPGMASFVLAPKPDRRLGYVKASYRTDLGVIESAWRYDADGAWTWTYVVPDGAKATVELPDGRRLTRTAGRYEETVKAVAVPAEQRLRPVGGLTRPLVAALALKLARDGKLDLDAPVSRVLGDERFAMTLRQCLSHTAGFVKSHWVYPADSRSVTEYLEHMRQESQVRTEPGKAFVSGPWGYYLTAAVIEKVTGEPFEAVLKRGVLEPLGMKDTVFVPSAEQMKRLAADLPRYPWLTRPFDVATRHAMPDCGLFSTREDLERFARWMLENASGDAAPFFAAQTGAACPRQYSFGFNVLSSDEIYAESATGCSLRIDRAAGTFAVRADCGGGQ